VGDKQGKDDALVEGFSNGKVNDNEDEDDDGDEDVNENENEKR
jgi:hypothetical protein